MQIKTIRKLFKKSKYSYVICISPDIIKKLGWREKQKLILEADTKTKKIVIKDWKPD